LGTAQFINLNALNDYFHSSPHSTLLSPVSSIGFEMSGHSDLYWSYAINWTPATSAQVNDSIRLRLSGWNSTLSFGGDLIKADAVDIVPTLGIGFQQLKLKVLNIQNPNFPSNSFQENDFKIYRNSSPTLNGMLNIRINMSSFTINLAGGYILDCAGQKWRYNGQYLKSSPKTSISGFVASVSIGIHIPDY
jgi:hypothetical protein